MLKRWDHFARANLDPAPTCRVGKRLIESGEIQGRIVDGWPWVDMDAWMDNNHKISELERRALELVK